MMVYYSAFKEKEVAGGRRSQVSRTTEFQLRRMQRFLEMAWPWESLKQSALAVCCFVCFFDCSYQIVGQSTFQWGLQPESSRRFPALQPASFVLLILGISSCSNN